MKKLSMPSSFDAYQFQQLTGTRPSTDDGWMSILNCPDNMTQEELNLLTIPVNPDWTKLRSSLYLSSEWYRVKTASIESAAIASELWHLFWNYDRYPEIGAEIVSTIAALKIVSSPTVEEKNAIAQIMRDCHIPELIVTAVEA